MMTPNEQISIFLEVIADYRNANADLRQKNEELRRKVDAAQYCEDMPNYEAIIDALKDDLDMVTNSNNEMLDQLTVLRQDNKNLKESNDQLMHALDNRMTECDELKSEIFILKDLIKKSEEHYRDKYSCDAFDEMADTIEDLKNEVKELQADLDEVTMLNDRLLDVNEGLNNQVGILKMDKESLIQKLQNINDEYLILHNEKMKMEKELELFDTIKDEVWEENPYFK